MSDELRRLEPGELAPTSGQYAVFDNAGAMLDREVTAVQGARLPPIAGGGFYLLADATETLEQQRRELADEDVEDA